MRAAPRAAPRSAPGAAGDCIIFSFGIFIPRSECLRVCEDGQTCCAVIRNWTQTLKGAVHWQKPKKKDRHQVSESNCRAVKQGEIRFLHKIKICCTHTLSPCTTVCLFCVCVAAAAILHDFIRCLPYSVFILYSPRKFRVS